ncbi:MAG: hypothetical protein ACFBSF_11290 [Leptolyngbyaceae cyanobacterium]
MVIAPLFWLGLSFLLVAVSLTAVLVTLIPAVRELGRAARSVEKLCDTLNRELPPTLESIRLTSLEITELTDDMTDGVQNASRVAQQVDQSVSGIRQQAKRVNVGTRSLMIGVRTAWKTLMQPHPRDRRRSTPRAAPARVSSNAYPDVAHSSQASAQGRSPQHNPPAAITSDASTPLPELPAGKTNEVDFTSAANHPLTKSDTSDRTESSLSRPDPLE